MNLPSGSFDKAPMAQSGRYRLVSGAGSFEKFFIRDHPQLELPF